ncbi:MAG: CcoQ/FixQ family Cbb3-type cytochrome c oxidase assembly chaperone [Bacteroidota bacterium]
MKFINYLKAISGVEIYPMISLFIFVVFFALLIFWAVKANKNLITAMKNIPLDDNQQNN